MASEKRFFIVAPQTLTSDGTTDGQLTIADTCLFKVKQVVILDATGVGQAIFEVKHIPNSTTMYVGPVKGNIKDRSDISAYTTALSATVEAKEQNRPIMPEQEVERATYEEEPTVARRTVLVDKYGDKISDGNPLPVEATVVTSSSGTPSVYNVNAATAGTEYSQLLPDNTTQFLVRARNNAKLQLAYISGNTSTTYLTVLPGNIYVVEAVKLTATTLYFEANKNSTIVEIVSWA